MDTIFATIYQVLTIGLMCFLGIGLIAGFLWLCARLGSLDQGQSRPVDPQAQKRGQAYLAYMYYLHGSDFMSDHSLRYTQNKHPK